MMAWIQSEQALRNHPKTIKAARLLNISKAEVIGYLHYLWWWAIDYAPDGDLSHYTRDDVETALEWPGQQGALYQALVDCGMGDKPGFIEMVNGKPVLHDWWQYGGKLVAKRQADAARKKDDRATSDGHPTDVQRTSNGRRR